MSARASVRCDGETYTFGDTSITTSGTFTSTHISRDGCDSITTLTLIVLESKSSSVDVSICEGSTYTIGNQSFSESGSYEIDFLTNDGCDSIITLNLSVVGSIEELLEVTICTGDSYEFNGESLTATGTYSSEHTSVNGCDSTVTLNLIVVDGFSEQVSYTICDGESVEINGIEYSVDISFEETFNSSSGCDSSVVYTVTVLPGIELSTQDYQICAGDEIEIGVSGAEGRAIQWTPVSGLSCSDCEKPKASPDQTITYTAVVEGCNGTLDSISLTVEVLPYPSITSPEDVTIENGESISLSVDKQFSDTKISWYESGNVVCENCDVITASPSTTTEYTIVGSNELGCTMEEKVTIFIEDDCDMDNIEIVNAMTVNNDGVNDRFTIRNNGQSEIILVQIFNRWGEIVFESTSIDEQWDGTYRNKPVNPAVFTYLVKVRCIGGNETSVLRGNVTVIR